MIVVDYYFAPESLSMWVDLEVLVVCVLRCLSLFDQKW